MGSGTLWQPLIVDLGPPEGSPLLWSHPRHPQKPPCRFGGSSSALEAVVGLLAEDTASGLGPPWCPPSARLCWRGPDWALAQGEGGLARCPQQVKSQDVLFLGW